MPTYPSPYNPPVCPNWDFSILLCYTLGRGGWVCIRSFPELWTDHCVSHYLIYFLWSGRWRYFHYPTGLGVFNYGTSCLFKVCIINMCVVDQGYMMRKLFFSLFEARNWDWWHFCVFSIKEWKQRCPVEFSRSSS